MYDFCAKSRGGGYFDDSLLHCNLSSWSVKRSKQRFLRHALKKISWQIFPWYLVNIALNSVIFLSLAHPISIVVIFLILAVSLKFEFVCLVIFSFSF